MTECVETLCNKVALCLSGQVRHGFKESMYTIKNYIIDRTNCDVFICASKNNSPRFEDLYTVLANLDIKCVSVRYIDDINLEENPPVLQQISDTQRAGFIQQTYFITECNNLKKLYEDEHNFKYGWVIRCRLDMDITSAMVDLSKLKRDRIYLPYHNKYAENKDYKTVYDRFAIGPSDLMNIYGNWYNLIYEMEAPDENLKKLVVVEAQLKYLLDYFNVKYEHLDMRMRRLGKAT